MVEIKTVAPPPLVASQGEVTDILKHWSRGKSKALEQLMPHVVDELRDVAKRLFRREAAGHTLQPTALVNEAFLRLVERQQVRWENRSHFIGFAAQLMRRILVDHARKRKADKRGGGLHVLSLEDAGEFSEARDIDLLALDDALRELARFDPEGSRVVELKFFGGLTHEEIAEALDVSTAKVRRQWTAARLWLLRELSKSDPKKNP